MHSVILIGVLLAALPGSGRAKTAEVLDTSIRWYGDSITLGACNPTPPPAKVQAALPGYVVLNSGVSGETVAQITTRYLAAESSEVRTDCLGEECGYYIFAGVTNDCGTGLCDPAVVLITQLAAVDDALQRGRRVVVVDGPPFRIRPTCTSGCVGGNYAGVLKTIEYNALLAAACQSSSRPNRHNLRCVATYPAMEAAWSDAADRGYLVAGMECSATDYVHTSDAGATALASLVITALESF